MRGIIEAYDGTRGTIRTKDGRTFPFTRNELVRRSRTPIVGARIVFRLKNGSVYRAAAGPEPSNRYVLWEVLTWPLELLLYLP